MNDCRRWLGLCDLCCVSGVPHSPLSTLPTSPSLLDAALVLVALRPGCSWVASAVTGPRRPRIHAHAHSVRSTLYFPLDTLGRAGQREGKREEHITHSKRLLRCPTRHPVGFDLVPRGTLRRPLSVGSDLSGVVSSWCLTCSHWRTAGRGGQGARSLGAGRVVAQESSRGPGQA